MIFYIDGDCPFCRWGARIFRNALRLKADIRPSSNDAQMHLLMQEHNSWILKTDSGELYYGFDAVTQAVSRSWLSFLAPVLRRRSVNRIGWTIYHLITWSRPFLSKFVPQTA